MYDWEQATSRLAAQAPWWEPGTASGYHALNQGHLVGEVVRRVTGKSLKQFVAEEIAGPLGADFQIGARASATGAGSRPSSRRRRCRSTWPAIDPDSPMFKTFTGPAADAAAANTPGWRRADIGARQRPRQRPLGRADPVGRSRSAARSTACACSRPDTIDLIFDEQCHGVDLVLGVPLRFGIGYGLPETETRPYLPRGRSASGAAGAAR